MTAASWFDSQVSRVEHKHSRHYGLESRSSLFDFVVVVVLVFRLYVYNFLTCVYNCDDH